jgi:hypothetical protein
MNLRLGGSNLLREFCEIIVRIMKNEKLKNHKLLANRQQGGVYFFPYRKKDKAEYNVANAKYLFETLRVGLPGLY